MKNILGLVFLIISINVFGQNPPGYQSRVVRERIQGSFMVDSTQHIPRYCGKPSGVRVGGSIQDGAIAMDTCNNVIYYYSASEWRPVTASVRCGLICSDCAVVTWTGTGLNFYVTAADYNLDGTVHHVDGDSISLDAADVSFGRFDAIVLTATGIDKVTGTASSDPQLPQVDPCEKIVLTYVLVGAGATTPTQITDEVIYDENVETWTHSTSGTITANFAGTVQVFRGTKSITVTTALNQSQIIFTAPSALLTGNYSTFSFWLKLTTTLVTNQNISVQFFNGSAAISNSVNANIIKTNNSSFQNIAFSMAQFVFTTNVFTDIKITFHGNTFIVPYIDWVRLQSGVNAAAPGYYTKFTDGTTTATASGNDIFKVRANLPLRYTVTNNDATHGDNILSSVDTSVAYTPSLATNARLKKIADSLKTLIGSISTGYGILNTGTPPNAILSADTSSSNGLATQFDLTQVSGSSGWSLSGNSLTAGSETGSFIGSTNSVSMRFRTNNTQRMVLDSIGRLSLNGGALSSANDLMSMKALNSSAGQFVFSILDGGGSYRFFVENNGTANFSGNTKFNSGTIAEFLSEIKINNSTGIDVAEMSTPSTPGSGFGRIYFKSDNLPYAVNDAGTEMALYNPKPSLNKGAFVASPTSADTIDVWQTPVAITITSLKAILRGSSSPSVTYNIGFGTNIQSPTAVFTANITCTSITTGCSNSSGFNDATIPAGSFIWIYTTAQSGTVRSIAFTINYTED